MNLCVWQQTLNLFKFRLFQILNKIWYVSSNFWIFKSNNYSIYIFFCRMLEKQWLSTRNVLCSANQWHWWLLPAATVARPTSGPTVASHTDFTIQLGWNHETKWQTWNKLHAGWNVHRRSKRVFRHHFLLQRRLCRYKRKQRGPLSQLHVR